MEGFVCVASLLTYCCNTCSMWLLYFLWGPCIEVEHQVCLQFLHRSPAYRIHSPYCASHKRNIQGTWLNNMGCQPTLVAEYGLSTCTCGCKACLSTSASMLLVAFDFQGVGVCASVGVWISTCME